MFGGSDVHHHLTAQKRGVQCTVAMTRVKVNANGSGESVTPLPPPPPRNGNVVDNYYQTPSRPLLPLFHPLFPLKQTRDLRIKNKSRG